MADDSLAAYKKRVRQKLDLLEPIFTKASIGDFSGDLKVPQKEDEFTHTLVGVKIMAEVIREKLAELETVNKKLVARIREKERMDRAKSEFLVILTHQLKSPLAAIAWSAEYLLSDKQNKLTTDQRQLVSKIYGSARREIKAVDHLLEFSKMELGAYKQSYKEVAVDDVVNDILSDLEFLVKQKHLKLQIALAGNNNNVVADGKMLEIIFDNLISNAIKYTRDNGEIKISSSASDGRLLVSVWNDGMTISKGQKGKLFKKLKGKKGVGAARALHGSGWGLYIVKLLCNKLGASLDYQSSQQKGTTFTVGIATH